MTIPNLLLAALPAASYRDLRRSMREVQLSLNDVLFESGKIPRHVYFPNDSMVSMVVVLGKDKGRGGLEVGLVGREGIAGFPLALDEKSPLQALVQGEGSAMRISAKSLARQLKGDSPLRRGLERSAYVAMVTAMQIAACNKSHGLEARLARWLLMVRDRVASDEFVMTQEFLARMLGVRRAGINEVAAALQRRQLIHYRRGTIRIVQPAALGKAACPCYWVIRELDYGLPLARPRPAARSRMPPAR